MPNSYFQFKQFMVHQEGCSMKVTTDACLFGSWVAGQLDGTGGRILDIGTGTGLLSLMIAQASTARIDAIEIQEADFVQALANIKASPWGNRITVLHGNVVEQAFQGSYDAIVSNPPFYEADLKGHITGKNIAHHNEGLTLYDLVGAVKKRLRQEGSFYLLFPAKREEELTGQLLQSGLFVNEICRVQQTEQHTPFRIMIKGSFRNIPVKTQAILIRNGREYSEAFKALLKPYYLYL